MLRFPGDQGSDAEKKIRISRHTRNASELERVTLFIVSKTQFGMPGMASQVWLRAAKVGEPQIAARHAVVGC